ncbi:MAG: enoyl-CoA hydratase/isomerase family protein [Blastocatellia bacterium]
MELPSRSFEHIRFAVVDRIARLELARPPHNVMTLGMLQEMRAALQSLTGMRGICAVLMTAAPGAQAFCAGVDLRELQGAQAFRTLETFHDLFRALHDSGKPLVLAVDGPVMGAGCELAAFADLVVAAEQTIFSQPEIQIGRFPPFASVFLPRVIGPKRAGEMILTGRYVDARQALLWGLVNQIVPRDQLGARTEEILQGMRQKSAASMELACRALRQGIAADFREVLERVERLYLEQLLSLDDAAEGLAALTAKRRPVWKDK